MLFAVVNSWSSLHEQASGDISCLSKANLQITVGGRSARVERAPFKKLSTGSALSLSIITTIGAPPQTRSSILTNSF